MLFHKKWGKVNLGKYYIWDILSWLLNWDNYLVGCFGGENFQFSPPKTPFQGAREKIEDFFSRSQPVNSYKLSIIKEYVMMDLSVCESD